jgi:pyruvate/2-oxoglutarate dehydrogenase complex dihydrolipoamide acyltransferase (E2) component
LDLESISVIYKPYHNISIAIHTPMGLVVPNIKSVHEKSILELSNDLMAIHEKGIKGLLTPEDFTGLHWGYR